MAASALPAKSFAPVVIVAVYCALAVRLDEGTNIALMLLAITVPATAVPPAVGLKVKLVVPSEAFDIASEKLADTEELSVTPVAALAGDVEDTVGGVVSSVVLTIVGVISGGCSAAPPPPPQPNRLRLASKAAVKIPAETSDLILPFDI